MKRAALAMVGGLLLATPAILHAEPDRRQLDALVAEFEAASADSDPAGYRALADRTLAEARRLYPADHPEVAARTLYVAMALASAGELDQAQALLDPIFPIIEKAESYRNSWRDALSLRGYILNFRGDHAGALANFTQVVALDETLVANDGGRSKATALSNLAASLLEHGRLDEALMRNAEAVTIGLALRPVPPDVAVWQANRVVYLFSAGRTEEAVAAAQDGVARLGAVIGADHPSMANLYANQGAVLLRLGRPRDAMQPIRRAFELVEQANGGPTQNSAAMRVQFAQAMVRAGQYEEAIAFLDAAVPIIDAQLGVQSDRAMNARDARLVALIHLGRGGEAEALGRDLLAVRDARLPEGHRDRANIRDNLAKAAFAQGKWSEARDFGRQAVALREKALPIDHPDLLLARCYLLLIEDRGDFRPAADLVDGARALLDALTLNAQLARGSAQADRQRPAYGWLAAILARRGAVSDAFRAQQWSARSSLDDILAQVAVERKAAANPALASRLAQRRDLTAARQGLQARIEGNMARPAAAFDMAGVTKALEDNRQAIIMLDASLSAVDREQLIFVPANLDHLLASNDRQRADVMITDLGDGWLVTALRAGAVEQALIGGSAPVNALAARLRASAAPGTGGALDRAASAELSRLLLPDAVSKLLRAAKRLTVVANGALGSLPFGLLAADRTGQQLLLDRQIIVRKAGTLRRVIGAKPFQQEKLVALGGVTGGPASMLMVMRSAGTAQTIAALPDLPEAGRELAAMAQAIGSAGSQLLLGDRATEAALRQVEIADGSVLAFATHGLLSGEYDGLAEPALVLTPADGDDGLLKPSEIGAMRLPAGLVILSACNTAAASSTDRPQLSGLVQGFLLAGAQRVLASHWPVRDDAARRLSVAMVRGLKAGAEPGDALRQAIATVRAGRDGEPALTEPALWAAFELFEADAG